MNGDAIGPVRLERDPPLAWVAIDRPQAHNAMNAAAWRALTEVCESLDADPAVRVVVLRGAGERAFISGADIGEFRALRGDASATAAYDELSARAWRALGAMRQPVIAMVNGLCFGGGVAVALACDLRFAAQHARFAVPATRLGLSYPLESIERLVHVCGPTAAADILLSARTLDAEEARSVGLVNRTVPGAELPAETREFRQRRLSGGDRRLSREASAAVRRAMTSRDGPLRGVRVLDLTRYLAGPFCTMTLGDMGADVVKLEAPSGARDFGAGAADAFYLSVNRSKRSATLDLHHPEGQAAFRRLASTADVVVENFRPSTMARLGLGADALRAANPRLVYCGISGFGADGPYAERPGFDQVAQAMSGLMSVTGTEQPTRVGIAIGDLLAGIFAAHGITLALYERERSGCGQVVHTSLLEGLVGVLSWSAGMYFASGTPPGLAGNHHPLSAPYGVHRARDAAFVIACGADRHWQALCRALGGEALLHDARFRTAAGRVAARAALTAALEGLLAARDVGDWVRLLNDAGVPCGPINDLATVFADPQVQARDMAVSLPHPTLGVLRMTGLPVKLSATPGRIERLPPALGVDTDAVLLEYGFAAAEIAHLRAVGAA
jgi:crotonobetainyl-CoA:carnitine CoA-transferase CaiB-like acyl-CoA transferase/1,4-dihydroxy-2-naphthoyl-CoA synthase